MSDLAKAILGASYSVWIRSSYSLLKNSGLIDAELKMVDARLDLRCLMEQPGFDGTDAPPPEDVLDPFPELDIFSIDQPFPSDDIASSYDWHYRWLAGSAHDIRIVVDAEREFILQLKDGRLLLASDARLEPEQVKNFEAAWTKAVPVGQLYVSEDITEKELAADRKIIVRPTQQWRTFLERVHKNPSALLQMNPREFEHFVAELLEKDGYQVKVTPYSKDGGVDIIAARSGLVRELYLVQCKHSPRRRPVAVDVVRGLYGVVNRDRATAGVVVTTSRLTRDAKRECQQLQHQMSFREYDDLVRWIDRVVRR